MTKILSLQSDKDKVCRIGTVIDFSWKSDQTWTVVKTHYPQTKFVHSQIIDNDDDILLAMINSDGAKPGKLAISFEDLERQRQEEEQKRKEEEAKKRLEEEKRLFAEARKSMVCPQDVESLFACMC